MGKMNIAIADEAENSFRMAIAKHMGVKKGNISKAIEEAIYLWIDHRSRERQRQPQRKTPIGWSGKEE